MLLLLVLVPVPPALILWGMGCCNRSCNLVGVLPASSLLRLLYARRLPPAPLLLPVFRRPGPFQDETTRGCCCPSGSSNRRRRWCDTARCRTETLRRVDILHRRCSFVVPTDCARVPSLVFTLVVHRERRVGAVSCFVVVEEAMMFDLWNSNFFLDKSPINDHLDLTDLRFFSKLLIS